MTVHDSTHMQRALDVSRASRRISPPNPWVGAVIVAPDSGEWWSGATEAPGGRHAEIVALHEAGPRARGATLYTTLEPCSHHGRTGPCTDAIIEAGIVRVVIGTLDLDEHVAGAGAQALRAAGLDVDVGIEEASVREELAAYLWHRQSGRPYVVLKVAATLDGRVAMADLSSKWITSDPARRDAHELRADCQAIVVGAGTVRSDDPELRARVGTELFEPLRVVLGTAPAGAKVHPCEQYNGELTTLLDDLGARGVVQLLVEGGPSVASDFLASGLVNRVVWYVAPSFAGSNGGLGALSMRRTETIGELLRGRIVNVRRIGEDVRMDVEV